MKIDSNSFLVTGAAGFIGSHVVDQLLAAGASQVIAYDRDTESPNLNRALRSGRVAMISGDLADRRALHAAASGVTGVFHLAVLPLAQCENNPRSCLEINAVGTLNVLEAAVEVGARKFVFSSASSVYGETAETMTEDHPLNARSMYGASKIAGEYTVRAFHTKHCLETVILRYMNVYGPRQQGGLIVNVLRHIQSGEPPSIAGDGSQSFDFVHVSDVAAANIKAMESSVQEGVFNIGSGTEATVLEIVQKILLFSRSNLRPRFVEGDLLTTRRVGKNDRARQHLDWRPKWSLDEGLQHLVSTARAP
jgi:UDP-glucose 4-epimerase